MANGTNFWEDVPNGKAIPERRIVKQELLKSRNKALEEITSFNGSSKGRKELKNKLFNYYLHINSQADKKSVSEETLKNLKTVRNILSKNSRELSHLDKITWSKILDVLERAGNEMNITNSTKQGKKIGFGYEVFNGLPFDGKKTRKYKNKINWYKLLATTKNFARHLRNDIDGLWVITGGNRVGKTTLAMQLAAEGDPNKIKEKHFIFNDDDFWHATDNLPKYSWPIVDELSSLFYSKDAMKGEQKSRKKKLKTFAKENMCLIGCDLNFYNLDKEMRSDKVTCNIHIPRRGIFEFYSKGKIEKFEKDKDSGNAIRPIEDFKGKFPDNNDETWKMYKELEGKKVTKKGSEKSKEIKEMAEEVKDDIKRYKKEYNNRTYIDKSLIEADFEIGNKKSKQIKKLVEADLEIQ